MGNPFSMTGLQLYSASGSGSTFNSSVWTANALNSKVLNAAGLSFIQSNLGTNGVNISFVRSSTNLYNIYGYGAVTPPTLVITYTNSCAGTPNPGNTISSSSTVCLGSAVLLSLQNQTGSSGTTYQWYKNSTLMAGATNAVYTVSVLTTDTYYCAVKCSSSNITTNSTPITISGAPFYTCYCTNGLGGDCNTEYITRLAISGTTLDHFTGICTNPYNAYPASGSMTATLAQGKTYQMLVHTNSSSTAPLAIGCWIDYNHNGLYEASEYSLISGSAVPGVTTTGSLLIPATALSGLTGMRVRVVWNGITSFNANGACETFEGETEDYTINIVPSSTCTNPLPACEARVFADTICTGSSNTLYLSNVNLLGANLTYQWYKGSGMIAGATNVTYTTQTTFTDSFYCAVTCSGTTINSSIQKVIVGFENCYCLSIANSISDEDIYNVTLNGVSTNPLYSYSNGCTNTAPGPNSQFGRYSNFKTLGPLTTIIRGTMSTISVVEDECNGALYFSNGIGIFIDYNHNASFSDPGEYIYYETSTTSSPRTITTNFNVPNNAMLGNTVMRVMVVEDVSYPNLLPCMSYSYGETEDYLINISVGPPCNGVPIPGNSISSKTSVCADSTVLLGLQNFVGSNATYQWYNNSGAISGASNMNYTATITQTEVFYCMVTCSGYSNTSTPITIYKKLLPECYCYPVSNGGLCITNVVLASYVNPSGCNNSFYSSYTSNPPILSTGVSYMMSATYSANAISGSWIDFNQNGIFETSEFGIMSTNSQSGSRTFLVPANAKSGYTVVRIRNRYSGNLLNSDYACTSLSSGETEDYLVYIVNPAVCTPVSSHQYVTACSSYTWPLNNVTYYASGNFFKLVPQVSDPTCVDTVFMHLTLNKKNTFVSLNACESFTWALNNTTYTTSGSYLQTTTSSSGCDSTVQLNLTVYQSASGSSSLTACNSYTWFGTTYTISGAYAHTFMNSHGCDSVHTLNLIITNGPATSLTASALNSYTWARNGLTYTASGIYTSTSINPGGCDSIHSLLLTIHKVAVSMTLQHVVQTAPNVFEYDVMLNNTGNTSLLLQGYSVGINHAVGMRGSGTLTHTVVSRDPILSILPPITPGYTSSSNHLRIITGNATAGNELAFAAGTSIRIATMRVTNSVNFPVDFNPDFQLQTITATGKTQCIAAAIVVPVSTGYSINGLANIPQAGTLQGLMGIVNTPCLFLNPSNAFVANVVSSSNVVCYGLSTGSSQVSLSGLGATPSSGNYSVNGGAITSYTSNPFTIPNLSAGVYTIHVTNSLGCFDTAVATITQSPPVGSSSFSVAACDSYSWLGTTYSASGSYNHMYQTSSGCDSIRTLSLTIHASPVVTASNVSKCLGGSVNLIGSPAGGAFNKPNPYSGPTTNYTYTFIDSFGCSATSAPASIIEVGCDVNVSLKLFIQGYYSHSEFMLPVLYNQGIGNDTLVTDSITVELHSTTGNFPMVASQKTILHTDGSAGCTFNYSPSLNFLGNSYYIVIRHRNGLTTWSQNPVTLTTTNTNYDFSLAANKAYGDNQIEIEPGIWAMFNGDLNGDENIDLLDNPILENDINEFQFGYFKTDLNGDGNVDLIDMPVIEHNIYNFIYSVHP